MKTCPSVLLLLALAGGLALPAAAVAQKSAGGVIGEARTRPGTWETTRSGRDFYSNNYRSRDNYRYNNSRTIVRSENAPEVVAQAPSDDRRFSYEPSQQTDGTTNGNTVSNPCGCNGTAVNEQAPAVAERSNNDGRSFSYDPAVSNSPRYNSMNTMRAQRMQSQTSQRDRYKLPAGTPEKYRVN